jgi:heme/copper-type cytochrome/quinol oxidase subunit 3
MRETIVGDLGSVPTTGFGSRTTAWWGTLGFISLEGTGFALASAALLYYVAVNPDWPLSAPLPDYGPGTIIMGLLLLSLIPNYFVKHWAEQERVGLTRLGIIIMSIFGILPLIVRWYEFPALNVKWDDNAYGSIQWFMLGLHTSHLLTDVGETLVLAALMFTRHGKSGKRLSDVSDNAFYWYFVVISWLPIYALIYGTPRL